MIEHTKRRRQLALSYLAIIMTLSLVFSCIIYGITMTQLDRPLPPPHDIDDQLQVMPNDTRFDERVTQTKESLLVSLLALNIAMLGAGSWVSYILARRTLKPVEEAMDIQSRFISDSSHELRTPLTALQTTIDVALRKKHIDGTKARDVLEKSGVEVSKLRDLTETLLTLAQTDTQKIKQESIKLDELVADVTQSMQDTAALKKIRLETVVESTMMRGDKTALAQILTILIDNAIKYSPDSSAVIIKINRTKHGIDLSVQDQGMGIAKKDQKRVFERFYRADSARTRTSTSGHGLGLAIAQSLCTKLGYQLRLSSIVNKGSAFTIFMPTQ